MAGEESSTTPPAGLPNLSELIEGWEHIKSAKDWERFHEMLGYGLEAESNQFWYIDEYYDIFRDRSLTFGCQNLLWSDGSGFGRRSPESPCEFELERARMAVMALAWEAEPELSRLRQRQPSVLILSTMGRPSCGMNFSWLSANLLQVAMPIVSEQQCWREPNEPYPANYVLFYSFLQFRKRSGPLTFVDMLKGLIDLVGRLNRLTVEWHYRRTDDDAWEGNKHLGRHLEELWESGQDKELMRLVTTMIMQGCTAIEKVFIYIDRLDLCADFNGGHRERVLRCVDEFGFEGIKLRVIVTACLEEDAIDHIETLLPDGDEEEDGIPRLQWTRAVLELEAEIRDYNYD